MHMELNLSIGDRLRELREDMELSQENVANELGIALGTISKYENIMDMDPGPISSENIVKLAKLYNVSADYLLGLTENKTGSNTPISDLRLSDSAIQVLRSQIYNNALISEILTHPSYYDYITDLEIYVKGSTTEYIEQMNKARTFLRGATYAARVTNKKNHALQEDSVNSQIEKMDKEKSPEVINERKYYMFLAHEHMEKIIDDIYNKINPKYSNKTVDSPIDFSDSIDALKDEKLNKEIQELYDPPQKITRQEKKKKNQGIITSLFLSLFGVRRSDISDEELDTVSAAYDDVTETSFNIYNRTRKDVKKRRKERLKKAKKSGKEIVSKDQLSDTIKNSTIGDGIEEIINIIKDDSIDE